MPLYYSTFVSGFLEPVSEALRAALPGCKIKLGLDGLIVYETGAKLSELQRLPFVTNTFAVIRMFPQNEKRSIQELAQLLLKDRAMRIVLPPGGKRRQGTFRIIPSLANQLVPLSPALMQALEDRIEEQTGARSHRAKPDTELWLLQRSEGYGFFSARVSQHRSFDKVLQRGELRPEIAFLLCQLSQPVAGELFLDPFCGSGAIPIQRAAFPTGLIFAGDSDCSKIEHLKERLRSQGLKKRIVARCENALDLSRYADGSMHAIVTDPPWGHYEDLGIPVREFYEKMVSEFIRLLRPDGKLVVLTGEAEIFNTCVGRRPESLRLLNTYDVLVSGKKASVFSLLRCG